MTVMDSRGSDPGKPDGVDIGEEVSQEVADPELATDGLVDEETAHVESIVDDSLGGLTDLGAGRGPSWLDEWIAESGHRVQEWRRHLHQNPELSRAEHETTAFLAQRLGEVGLHPRFLPGTGLICDLGPETHHPRHVIALRADLDALPITETTGSSFASKVDGSAHACGHDAHTAILLGAAQALASAPSLSGRIRLIFQPAEEVMPGGALDVIAAGGLDGVERVFGLHCDPRLPVGQVGSRVGAITSAADLLELRLSSPGGHTSRPHLSADLVHALGTVITDLPTLLSRRVDPRTGTVLVWGSVHAGDAPNAIPQDGALRGTLRTGDRDTWSELEPLVHELVQGLLAPLGVGFDLRHRRGLPPVVNDAESTATLRTGIERAVGAQGMASTPQSSGGEDFGWYLEHVPGSFARLGVRSEQLGEVHDLHRPAFDLDERALLVGVRLMVNTALAALEESGR